MTKLILLFYLFCIGNLTEKGNPQQIISCHYKNISFIDFCKKIESQTGITIFYKKEWIDNIQISINKDSISVENALKFVLKDVDLKINQWENNLIITKDKNLLTKLPDYIPDEKLKQKQEKINTKNYLKTKGVNQIKQLVFGSTKSAYKKQKQGIRIKVTDNDNGSALVGATMYIKELQTGAVTNQDGILEKFLYPGIYTAKFEFMGYSKKEYHLMVNSSGNSIVKLEKSGFNLDEVNIYADKLMEREPGVEKIRNKVIKKLPMLMGEVDVLKVAEMLPGIVSVGEGSSGVNVRGGGADQNAFYINKIPILNTSHLFGFSSAFNPDIIKNFSIYKGYIPLQYGGRLASVFDINTRHGNKDHFTAHGGISPIATNLVLESPLKKDTASFIVSGRSSYSDWILSRIKNKAISASNAKFYDISAELNYDLSKTQASLFYYRSNDFFAYSNISQYQYSNNGLSLNINHQFNKSIRGIFNLATSIYQFNTIDDYEPVSAYQQNYSISQTIFTSDFIHKINEKHQLNYGANLSFFNLDRGSVIPNGRQSLRKGINMGKEKGAENAIYVSDKYKATTWLDFNFGLRFSLYTPMGAKKVYLYKSNQEKSIENIIDSLQFGNFEVINWNFYPEIRAAIHIQTDKNGALKLAFNQMHQNLFMLNTTIAVAPNSQWKLADYYLKPATGNQISLGIFRDFPNLKLESSVELYYSKTKNYTEFKDGADFLNTALVETSVLQGNQHAYGLELMIKKRGKKLDGWITYTYSRSLIQVTGQNDWDKINNGKIYPANFDIPNSFNAVINYTIKKRVSLSSVITYQTGKPLTFPTSVYYVNASSYLDYSSRNAYRIPDYFRIDLSLKLEGNFKRNKFMHSSWQFGIYNLTGRDNAYSVFFKTESGITNGYQYSVIAVPIVNLSWIFKLGNYEAL